MPKVKWGVAGSDVDDIDPGDGDFVAYEGPVPPKGVYRCDVKKVEYVKFSTGSKGLKVLLVIHDSNKPKYAGAPLWDNIVDSDAASFKIRQWLDAIGGTGKDWDGTVIDNDNMVTKFGRIAVSGLQVVVATKTGSNQDGDPRAEIARYLPFREPVGSSGNGTAAQDESDEDAPF